MGICGAGSAAAAATGGHLLLTAEELHDALLFSGLLPPPELFGEQVVLPVVEVFSLALAVTVTVAEVVGRSGVRGFGWRRAWAFTAAWVVSSVVRGAVGEGMVEIVVHNVEHSHDVVEITSKARGTER